jgi:hypothetical protein
MRPADDLSETYKKAERRLRGLLLGDGLSEPGVVKGDERRGRVVAELRRMREALDELTQHQADLAEELLQAAQQKTTRRAKSEPREQ